MNECSIGIQLHEECHKTNYSKTVEYNNRVISDDIKYLISKRTDVSENSLSDICSFHFQKYVTYYSREQRICCDPLGKHSTKHYRKGKLMEISISLAKESNVELIPGQKLCFRCKGDLMRSKNTFDDGLSLDNEKSEENESCEEIDENKTIADINAELSSIAMSVSPISNTKLSKKQIKRKLEVLADTMKAKILKVGNLEEAPEKQTTKQMNETHLNEILAAVRQRIQESNDPNEKVSLLTVAPMYWSIEKCATYFQVSSYMIRESRKQAKLKGILSKRELHNLEYNLKDKTKQLIIEFYESSEHTRILPGKKDCISIKTANGKEQKQRMLILCNLKELYSNFKVKYPDNKIGFSSFASLRPKWCVLAGSAGTHTVCVCTYHENVKLKLAGLNKSLDYKNVMANAVCDQNSKDCMFHECNNCPGLDALREILEPFITDVVSITFRQWVTVDRSELITITEDADDFCENLCKDIWELTKHECIRQKQAAYLSQLKMSLPQNSIIVIGDFSENYKCIIQESIQVAYFATSQITLHPFVIYYNTPNGLSSKSFCVVSSSLVHNHLSVHSFICSLIPAIKNIIPELKHISYFTDGSAAQYKNR